MRYAALMIPLLWAGVLRAQAPTSAAERQTGDVPVEESRAEVRRLLGEKRGNTEFDEGIAELLAAFDARHAQDAEAKEKDGAYRVGYHALLYGIAGLHDHWEVAIPQQRFDYVFSIEWSLRSIAVNDAAGTFHKELLASDFFRKSPSVFHDDVMAALDACVSQKKAPDFALLLNFNQPSLGQPDPADSTGRRHRQMGDYCMGLGLYERALANYKQAGPENLGAFKAIDAQIALKEWDAASAACDALEKDLPRWDAVAARYEGKIPAAPPPIFGQTSESLRKLLADKRAAIAAGRAPAAPSPATR